MERPRQQAVDEAEHTLDVVDAKTLTVGKRIALSGRPNNVAISRDGRHVYVAIVSAPSRYVGSF